MRGISPSQFIASAALLRRIGVMARFIREKHALEFQAYWDKHYSGKAESGETLAFFADKSMPSKFYLHRVED